MPENKQEQPLLFDPEKHEYFEGKKKIPSVTDVVGDECGRPDYATAWHMNRGSQVHRCLALYLAERLDETSVDPRIKDRVNQGIKAIRDLDIHPRAIEMRMSHRLLGFAGTPDLLAEAQGMKGDVVVDWKSSHDAATEIQIGGYAELYDHHGYRRIRTCFEIVLEDTTYHIFEYQPRTSRALFRSALNMYKWRQANGGKKGRD